MNFIDKMERKLGKYAVHNLMLYLIAIYVVGFFILLVNEQFYYEWLCLDISQVLKGQVWRLVTFLCYPPDDSPIFFILLTLIYFSLGKSLESAWGTFKFNLYIIMGILCVIAAAYIVYFLFDQNWILTADYIYMSMLLAMAATFPDTHFLILFVIPVKAKWLGLFYGLWLAVQCIEYIVKGVSSGYDLYWALAIEIVLSLINFIIFFFLVKKPVSSAKNTARRTVYKMKVDKAKAASAAGPGYKHKCSVCGITDRDNPNMEFRYCSQCDGAREYCSDHLYTHIHIHSETKS